MSDLFRKEAMARRSRALFGDVILRAPLSWAVIAVLVIGALALIAFILFGVSIDGSSVWAWLRA